MSTLVLSFGLGPLLQVGHRFHGFSYRKLLGFLLNGESGELVDSAVTDGPADTYYLAYGREELCAGKSPFLSVPSHGLVFDTQTRIFYEFPEFHSVALVRGGSYK